MIPRAIVTGGSRGLGLALVKSLVAAGWRVVVDARDGDALGDAVATLGEAVIAVSGDISDPVHREDLVEEARALGGLDLLVNNASVLGPSPQPSLAAYPLEVLRRVYEVNVIAPLALTQLCLPLFDGEGMIINITSDAGVEAYPGWGGYGSSKAALEQISNVLAAEHPDLAVYWVDPGEMNTRMHQEAFPGEDISDRPPPEESVPGLMWLIESRPPPGRYRVADLETTAP
jgi:NAD(P)-dependent dehydrogenase (short-subunit alcohol dehydrogenase family)